MHACPGVELLVLLLLLLTRCLPCILQQGLFRTFQSVQERQQAQLAGPCSNSAAAEPTAQGLGEAAAAAAAAVPLPQLQRASGDEAQAWIHELAGDHDLSVLAHNVPHVTDKQQLFKALWRARAPCTRAAWFVRILYTHWAHQQPHQQPHHGRGHPHASAASPPDLRSPAFLQKCNALWTSHILEHLDSLLPPALTALQSVVSGAATNPVGGDPCLTAPQGRDLGGGVGVALDFSSQPDTQQGPPGAPQSGFLNTLSLANAALAASAAPFVKPGPLAKMHFFARLAGHTFEQGMGDGGQVLEWAARMLGGAGGSAPAGVGAGGVGSAAAVGGSPQDAEDYKATLALPLLLACVQVGRGRVVVVCIGGRGCAISHLSACEPAPSGHRVGPSYFREAEPHPIERMHLLT